MSNIPEETGKVATSAIDALRGNPLCLAVVVLAIVMAIIAFFRERHGQEDRAKIVNTLIERCVPMPDQTHNPPRPPALKEP